MAFLMVYNTLTTAHNVIYAHILCSLHSFNVFKCFSSKDCLPLGLYFQFDVFIFWRA